MKKSLSSSLLPLSLRWQEVLLTTQEWAQSGWNLHAAIGLLVNFHQGQHDTRRSKGSVVERVNKLHFAFFVAVAYIDTAGLPVVKVRAGMCLTVSIFAWQPAFQVVHAHLAIAHISCADIDHTIGQLQGLHQLFRICYQRFVPAHRFCMVGLADDVLLYLIELVSTKQAACILTVGASLAAEAGAEGNKEHGHVQALQYFILEHAGDRDFAGADEEGVIILNGVDLVASFGELTVANKAEFTRHGRYDKRGETFLGYAIKGEIHERQFKAGRVMLENIAARPGDLDAALDIQHVQVLHDGVVIAQLEVKGGYDAPVLEWHIVVLIFADGSAGIRNVRHEVEQLLALFQKVVEPRFHAFDLLGQLFAFGDELLAFLIVFGSFRDLFRDLVLLSASLFHLAL